MAHCSPMAGHFGQARTLATIWQSMDWPNLTMDVINVCMSCPICQWAKPMTTQRAPLHSLPVMSFPFQRVAMDIFGPLKRTKSGNKYVLVVMDYATKWPEAFPLKNTSTETLLDCLVEMTTRLGIPEEVLSDNGSNGIHQVKTSPYHPQTDGMVERFNATMKRLLKKLTQKSVG